MTFTDLKLSEHQIQSAFFQWVRVAEKIHPRLKLMFAVPNAGKRGYKTAAMLIAEGLRKGVLDVLFPVASSGFNGLAIEFKKPGGVLTPEQEDFADALTGEGWLVVMMTDSHGAISLVKNYLGLKNV
jgi:hypothetical protein